MDNMIMQNRKTWYILCLYTQNPPRKQNMACTSLHMTKNGKIDLRQKFRCWKRWKYYKNVYLCKKYCWT